MDGETHHANGNILTEEHDFKIRGAASTNQPAASKSAKSVQDAEACTICLEPISERAIAVPCNHLTFDFLCLVSWLQERNKCPLCNGKVTQVEYDYRSPTDFKTYHVPEERPQQSTISAHTRRAHLNLRRRRRRPVPQLQPLVDVSLDRRRHIYRNRLYALHIGSNRTSGYRDFTAQVFAQSAELQSRARIFLRRELQLFTFLNNNPRAANRDFLIEYIVAILKINDLRGADGRAEELLKDFLGGENTRQLLHELEAWLRSPYTSLREWDENVQYADRGQSRAAK